MSYFAETKYAYWNAQDHLWVRVPITAQRTLEDGTTEYLIPSTDGGDGLWVPGHAIAFIGNAY